jgi:hypothetical protein
MNLSNNRRGFYIASPFLGMIFFIIVASVGAAIINENEQQLNLASVGQTGDLVFYMQALDADFNSILLQNNMQYVLDTLVVDPKEDSFKDRVEDGIRASVEDGIEAIYVDAYYDNLGIGCVLTGKPEPGKFTTSGIWLLFTFYPPGTKEKVIDIDGSTEMKPVVSGYGIECVSSDPELLSHINLKGRRYYLDAINICKQKPDACLWA